MLALPRSLTGIGTRIGGTALEGGSQVSYHHVLVRKYHVIMSSSQSRGGRDLHDARQHREQLVLGLGVRVRARGLALARDHLDDRLLVRLKRRDPAGALGDLRAAAGRGGRQRMAPHGCVPRRSMSVPSTMSRWM